MSRIYVAKLNPQLKKNILNRKYDMRELEIIRDKVSARLKDKQKMFYRALFMVVLIVTVLLGVTYSKIPSNVFWFTAALVLSVVFAALAVSWVLSIGFMKYQFNSAIRRAYPECAVTLSI